MCVSEKSKISRAEENKQSQCVEGCDWWREAGDLMPASDWSRGEETRPATTQRRGIDPARRCQLCQARRGRIGNILRFLTLVQLLFMCLLRVMSCIKCCISSGFSLASPCIHQLSRCQACYQVPDSAIQSTRLPVACNLSNCNLVAALQGESVPSDQNPFRTSRLGQGPKNRVSEGTT